MAADIAGFISRSSDLAGIQPLKNGENVMKSSKKTYGKVIISLENCLLPAERLYTTPSHKDGLDPDTEMDLRIVGCELIQTAGILLRLPQVAMATGQVLFQRFYYSKSFVRHPMEVTAMGCVCLASKIEEAPRRVRDVISVFHHIKQVKAGRNIAPVLLDQNYINLKNQVIKAERRVLKELGFCVHVKHPHKIIFSYLQQLGFLSRDSSNTMGPRMLQQAWNYMNDSLRTDVFLRYSPETIACACIYLAARQLKQALPSNPAWFSIYDCLEDDLKEISVMILKLYQRPKADPEKLERMVNNLQKAYQDARQKNRGGVGVADSKPGTPSKQEGGSDGFSSPRPKKDRRDESHGRRRSRSYDRKRRSSSGADSPSPRRDKKRRRSRSRSDSRKRLDKDHGRSRDERHAKDRRRGKENDRSFSRSLSPDRKSHKHKAKRDVSHRNDHKGRRSKDAEKKKDKKR